MQRSQLKDVQRVVIKIGTNSIMLNDKEIDYRKLDRLAFVISSLKQEGKEVVFVTSGAVAVGASLLGYDEYPREIPVQQAAAAVGQTKLMDVYSGFFSRYDCTTGQVLITRDVVDFPQSLENVTNALSTLLDQDIIPIINENDAVSVDEMNHMTRFGDNDTLGAIVAGIVDADLLIILSDVDGFYNANPSKDPQAKKFDIIEELTEQIEAMAQGKGSEFASGGMETKLVAADYMLQRQKALVIMSGGQPDDLFTLFEGGDMGTLFAGKDTEF